MMPRAASCRTAFASAGSGGRSEKSGVAAKDALTVRLWLMVSFAGLAQPSALPSTVQPVKTNPIFGVAVRVTVVPVAYCPPPGEALANPPGPALSISVCVPAPGEGFVDDDGLGVGEGDEPDPGSGSGEA